MSETFFSEEVKSPHSVGWRRGQTEGRQTLLSSGGFRIYIGHNTVQVEEIRNERWGREVRKKCHLKHFLDVNSLTERWVTHLTLKVRSEPK